MDLRPLQRQPADPPRPQELAPSRHAVRPIVAAASLSSRRPCCGTRRSRPTSQRPERRGGRRPRRATAWKRRIQRATVQRYDAVGHGTCLPGNLFPLLLVRVFGAGAGTGGDSCRPLPPIPIPIPYLSVCRLSTVTVTVVVRLSSPPAPLQAHMHPPSREFVHCCPLPHGLCVGSHSLPSLAKLVLS
jgi:hypothetical protein